VQTNFDIYKRLQSGKPIWITSVPEIEEARVRVNRLEGVAPGEYLIYSEEKGLVVERVTNTNIEKRIRRVKCQFLGEDYGESKYSTESNLVAHGFRHSSDADSDLETS
jgi:hypothetical protein